MQIAFNPGFLLDGLGAVAGLGEGDVTRLSFTGPTRPAVLTGKRQPDPGADEGTADYRYLLMPVRLSG